MDGLEEICWHTPDIPTSTTTWRDMPLGDNPWFGGCWMAVLQCVVLLALFPSCSLFCMDLCLSPIAFCCLYSYHYLGFPGLYCYCSCLLNTHNLLLVYLDSFPIPCPSHAMEFCCYCPHKFPAAWLGPVPWVLPAYTHPTFPILYYYLLPSMQDLIPTPYVLNLPSPIPQTPLFFWDILFTKFYLPRSTHTAFLPHQPQAASAFCGLDWNCGSTL